MEIGVANILLGGVAAAAAVSLTLMAAHLAALTGILLRRTRLTWTVIGITCCSYFAVQLAGFLYLRSEKSKLTDVQLELYRSVFDGVGGRRLAGLPLNYRVHHYLNYALNPEKKYGAVNQFNAQYLIRRSSVIAPRANVPWRALVIGGSTAFGEQVMREEDTWVWRLEKLLREKYDARIEIINGGVGGYTIAENFIHYLTLLRHLDPDAILLYTGINDVHARLVGSTVPDYANYRRPWRDEPLPQPNPLLSAFFLYRAYYLRLVLDPARSGGIGGFVSFAHPPPTEWHAALDRNSARIYLSYLESFIRMAQAEGRRAIVIPQYYSEEFGMHPAFLRGISEHNQGGKELAQNLGVPFFSEVAQSKQFTRLHTFDSYHFNEAGSALMAQIVSSELQRVVPDLTNASSK